MTKDTLGRLRKGWAVTKQDFDQIHQLLAYKLPKIQVHEITGWSVATIGYVEENETWEDWEKFNLSRKMSAIASARKRKAFVMEPRETQLPLPVIEKKPTLPVRSASPDNTGELCSKIVSEMTRIADCLEGIEKMLAGTPREEVKPSIPQGLRRFVSNPWERK